MPRISYWILDTTTVESIPTLAPAPRGAVPSLNRLCSLSCRGRMQPASDHAAGSMQKFGLLSFLPPSTPLHALLTNKLPLRARLGFLATRRSACFRRARTIHGGSRAARRFDRHQDLRGLSHTRRQHGGSRPHGVASESILNHERRYVVRGRGSSSTSSPIVMRGASSGSSRSPCSLGSPTRLSCGQLQGYKSVW